MAPYAVFDFHRILQRPPTLPEKKIDWIILSFPSFYRKESTSPQKNRNFLFKSKLFILFLQGSSRKERCRVHLTRSRLRADSFKFSMVGVISTKIKIAHAYSRQRNVPALHRVDTEYSYHPFILPGERSHRRRQVVPHAERHPRQGHPE